MKRKHYSVAEVKSWLNGYFADATKKTISVHDCEILVAARVEYENFKPETQVEYDFKKEFGDDVPLELERSYSDKVAGKELMDMYYEGEEVWTRNSKGDYERTYISLMVADRLKHRTILEDK